LTERIQKFSDSPLKVCPHCGGELEQVLSAPAIQFKGSGWYVSDYAKKASDSAAAVAKGNGSTPPSTPESKAEPVKSETTSKNKATSSKEKTSDKK
jgi:putative FmdB family regulatory protein